MSAFTCFVIDVWCWLPFLVLRFVLICWDWSFTWLCIYDDYDMAILRWMLVIRGDVLLKIFMHVDLRLIEDVTTISWIFIIFACFIALIEVGRYTGWCYDVFFEWRLKKCAFFRCDDGEKKGRKGLKHFTAACLNGTLSMT